MQRKKRGPAGQDKSLGLLRNRCARLHWWRTGTQRRANRNRRFLRHRCRAGGRLNCLHQAQAAGQQSPAPPTAAAHQHPTPAPAPQKQDTTAKPASTAAATPPSTSSQSPATSTQSAVVAAAGDVTAGRQVFRKCQACHSLDPGKNLVGQSLAGSIHRCGNRPRRAPRKDERSRQEDEFLVLLRHSMRLGAYLEDQCCVAVCVLTALNSAANAGFALPGWLTASAFCRFDDGSPTTISPTMPIA